MAKTLEFQLHTILYENFLLGSGAFGQVFNVLVVNNAQDSDEKMVAAVKKIKLRAPAQRSDYMNEVEILSKLGTHEQVTRLIAWSLIDEEDAPPTLYILMEYCDGGTLSERLCNSSSDLDHLSWMRQLAKSLKYIHSKGIAHRDIKPDNILIKLTDQSEQLKICDFSVSSKASEKLSPSMISFIKSLRGSLVFPRLYAAPEVVKMCTPYNVKSEVFSLGAIFYGILERSYLEERGKRHYGAFVVVPAHGKLPLGHALSFSTSPDKTEMVSFSEGSPLSNNLKQITSTMIQHECSLRPSAEDVCTILADLKHS